MHPPPAEGLDVVDPVVPLPLVATPSSTDILPSAMPGTEDSMLPGTDVAHLLGLAAGPPACARPHSCSSSCSAPRDRGDGVGAAGVAGAWRGGTHALY